MTDINQSESEWGDRVIVSKRPCFFPSILERSPWVFKLKQGKQQFPNYILIQTLTNHHSWSNQPYFKGNEY